MVSPTQESPDRRGHAERGGTASGVDLSLAHRSLLADETAPGYLRSRGFTAEEIERFNFGLVQSYQDLHRRCLVIPYPGDPRGYYAIRALKPEDPGHKFRKAPRDWYGHEPIFNAPAIERENHVGGCLFVVESQLCALSIEALGFSAIACGGTGGTDRARETIVAAHFKGSVISMMDADGPEKGPKASAQLRRDLEEGEGIFCESWDTSEYGAKDPNELFARSREALADLLGRARASMGTTVEEVEDKRRAALLAQLGTYGVVDSAKVVGDIMLGANVEAPTPTGLAGLDDVLGGGLRTGLYVLGATSSMGKTTLCVQIADTIASHGRPVLFVTVEQSREEIISKSLSRMISECGEAFPTGKLMADRSKLSSAERSRLSAACDRYVAEVAPLLQVMEPNGRPSAATVALAAETMAELHGRSPVVIVDYLQLLGAENDRDDVRLATDKNVTLLRQLAKRLKSPVVVISNIKRDAYAGGIDMDSWKESGGIEYSADVLLGLQPLGIGDSKDAKAESRRVKAQDVRACEVVVLKNRAGRTTDEGIPVTFHAVASRFTDGIPAHQQQTSRASRS